MDTLLLIALLIVSNVASFFAGAHNAKRANVIKTAAKQIAKSVKR
jgi:uncharacterized protein (UPF0333 family)